jgi:nucleoside-diphosphate kinase
MPNERTLTLVKPDGTEKHLTGVVLERYESAGLQLAGLKMLRLSRSQAENFYKEHKGKPFYEPLIEFMISAPIVAAVWEGENAIALVRQLMGATNSKEAKPGTLRKQFGTDNRQNLVHGSDSPASAEREIQFFFKSEEIFHYGESKKTSHSLPTR